MNNTPRSLRLRIGLFGRTNTGKSSFLNMVTNQPAAVVSSQAGTTTDVVVRSMELLPIGPVTFLDSAGLDDRSTLGDLRVEKSRKALSSSDLVLLVTEADGWSSCEDELLDHCRRQKTPVILVVNKTDVHRPGEKWLAERNTLVDGLLLCSCTEAEIDPEKREACILELKRLILNLCPEEWVSPPPLLGDLLPKRPFPCLVLIVPIDLEAPKGRIILPQVQAIRDGLDHAAAVLTLKEDGFLPLLKQLKNPPDLVVCDSQVADLMARDTPSGIPATTFSILFARYKGDLVRMAEGAAVLGHLQPGMRVLVAEACTHHPLEDDIGRVKIPRWIERHRGKGIAIDHCAGKDYPEDLSGYHLVIHCGGCMLTRRQMLWRMEQARLAEIPLTNYGVAISVLLGVVERTLEPFPAAYEAYRQKCASFRPLSWVECPT